MILRLSCVLSFGLSFVGASDFTVSSYNCGGLSDHYDYIRAAAMQKLVQTRYQSEPEAMARLEKIQAVALKVLFGKDQETRQQAQSEWDKSLTFFDYITRPPVDQESPNTSWNKMSEAMLTTYHVRPIRITDSEVSEMLTHHLQDINRLDGSSGYEELLDTGRYIMGKRIFQHHLKYDIVCLQEADYLDEGMFPENYEVLFSDTDHSVNGVAWNKEKFDLIEIPGDVKGRGFVVKLREKQSGKGVLVATGHLTGCNPFRMETKDSVKGDNELKAILELLDSHEADIKLIGMDSNVTAMHPRMHILKDKGYILDSENYLEPTCTNPYQVLNTRIDWIALKSTQAIEVCNIPVMGVGLNSIQTNISDHKPIAAKVEF